MSSTKTLKIMKNMFNGKLPVVFANVITGLENGKYISTNIPVEVLSIHFNTGNMRVRYIANIFGDDEIRTQDISNDSFFEMYKLAESKEL